MNELIEHVEGDLDLELYATLAEVRHRPQV